MSETLPLFPLGTVLFPGLLLPLNIFEDRYRRLVRDLLAGPGPQRFGVIAIRRGRETGVDGVSALFEVGCTAAVRQVEAREDGGFNLVTAGAQRFRLLGLDRSLPYLRGEVELLTEETGDPAAVGPAARAVQRAFRAYLDAVDAQAAARVRISSVPDEPVALSYLVAATVLADLADKQELLAAPDALHRLTAERALLSRETTMLRTLTSAPAPDLRHSPYSSN
jgi:Lon protease-like protein